MMDQKQIPLKKRTYLSRIESDYNGRQWYRRDVTLLCNLLYTTNFIRKPQLHKCMITELSEGGACLRIGKLVVPDHVYLVLGQFDYVLGSVVIERTAGHVHLCFQTELAPAFVNRISRLPTPFSTLESLKSKTEKQ